MGRYKNFFGLNNPDDYKVAAAEMKRKGDFTAPTSMAPAEAVKPADAVLKVDAAAA